MNTLNYRKNSFLNKSKEVHNNKYDYSLVEYVNAHTKVKIICKDHGIFEQEPDSHIRNHGCKNCNGGTVYSSEQFIKKAKNIHNNEYDYSSIKYKNNYTSILIFCKKHNSFFEQKPYDHLNGCGCKLCGLDKYRKKRLFNTEIFTQKAINIHGGEYDYSLVEYKNSKSKVKIICKNHGVFTQLSNSHLLGAKCPSCRHSKGEKNINKFLEQKMINFIPQMKFIDCRYERPLPFDFYLPDYNLCIEYDGIQHFKPIKKFGGKEAFENTILYDSIKTEYCSGLNNKPKLIRINYKQFNEIEKILLMELRSKL